jgi:hypothetical protein
MQLGLYLARLKFETNEISRPVRACQVSVAVQAWKPPVEKIEERDAARGATRNVGPAITQGAPCIRLVRKEKIDTRATQLPFSSSDVKFDSTIKWPVPPHMVHTD